jgi:hypothetical protein
MPASDTKDVLAPTALAKLPVHEGADPSIQIGALEEIAMLSPTTRLTGTLKTNTKASGDSPAYLPSKVSPDRIGDALVHVKDVSGV